MELEAAMHKADEVVLVEGEVEEKDEGGREEGEKETPKDEGGEQSDSVAVVVGVIAREQAAGVDDA